MARLFSSGFELNSTTNGLEWTTVTNGSIVTSPVRSGTYAGRVTSFVSGQPRGFLRTFRSNSSAATYCRFYFRYATLPTADNWIFLFEDDTTLGRTGSGRTGLQLSSTGTLKLMADGFQVGSASSALSADTWYRIEIFLNTAPAAGSREMTGRLDGTTFATSSTLSLTTFTSYGAVTFGANLGSEAQTQGDWYFDDIAVNDTGGSQQNSWPGDGKIVHLRPNGAGDNAATLGTFADIDEVTPDDATSFIDLDESTTVADYACDSSSSVGIASNATVSLVEVGIRIREEVSATTSYQLRIKSASGGTTSTSAATDAGSTTWRTNPNGSTSFTHRLVSYTDPTTGSAWTPTGTNSLDNMQIGVASLSANDIDVSTLWALVEYVPSGSTSETDTHTIDAYKVNRPTATHTTDAFRLRRTTSAHTADALRRASVGSTHTINAVAKRTMAAAHTIDATLVKRGQQSHSMDGLRRAVKTTTHTVNALLLAQKTASHSVDTYPVNRVTATHTLSSLLVRTVAASHTLSSLLRTVATKAHTVSSLAIRRTTTTHTTDTLAVRRATSAHSLNSLLLRRVASVHNIDSLLRKTATASHAVSALLFKRLVAAHTVDALRIARLSAGHTLNALLRRLATATHTATALLLKRISATHSVDSLKKARGTIPHTINSLLLRRTTSTHTANALRAARTTAQHTISAFLIRRGTTTHTLDALLKRVFLNPHSPKVSPYSSKSRPLTPKADLFTRKASPYTDKPSPYQVI